MVKVSQGHIRKWLLLKPTLKEQQIIVNYLDIKLENISKLQQKIRHQIDKLAEIKQILIAEAVTGKIKV